MIPMKRILALSRFASPLLALGFLAAGLPRLADRWDPAVRLSTPVPGPALPLPVVNEVITQ